MRFLMFAGFILTACASNVSDSGQGNTSCGGGGYNMLVGQSVDVLAAMTFPTPMRVIKPGMAITMDYNPDRLNIDVDANNRITRVWCG